MDGIIINDKVYKALQIDSSDCDSCDLLIDGECIGFDYKALPCGVFIHHTADTTRNGVIFKLLEVNK